MLDARSPLAADARCSSAGLTIAEAPNFLLTQIAGDESALIKAFGTMPDFGKAMIRDERTLLRVAPRQIWVLGTLPPIAGCYATPLSSGRTRFLLEGAGAASLLSSCAAYDFAKMTDGEFVMTGIHHTPVLIHAIAAHTFHVYTMRSFARSVWDWLEDAARVSI